MRFLKERIAYYLLLSLPGLIIFFPVLFQKHIFADGDAVLQLYPAMDFFRAALKNGTSFIWNPHVMTGFVSAAGLMEGFFFKLNQVVYQALPVTTAYAWLTFLSFWLTSVFTFEFVRKLGLGTPAGLFAAFVFPWITANFLWAGYMTVTAGLFLFPLLLYLCLVFHEDMSWKHNVARSVIAGLVVGTALNAYHFQWAFFMMVIIGAWAVFLDLRAKRFRVTGWMIFTVGIAALIALQQYVWLFRLLPFSAREGGLSFQEVKNGLLIPGDVLSAIFPNLSLPQVVTSPGFFYIGALPMLLFILSWFCKKNFYYRFFGWLLAVSLLISFRFSPIAWLLHQLPIFSSFRAIPRIMHFGLFGAVILASYGFEALMRNEATAVIQAWIKRFWKISAAFLVVFLVGSVALGVFGDFLKSSAVHYFESHYQESDLTLPKEHYYQVIERTFSGVRGGLAFPHAPVTVAVLSLIAGAALLRFRGRLNQTRFTLGMLTLTALNLVLINYSMVQTRIVSAQTLWEPPPVVEYLKEQQGDFRVMTLFPGSATFTLLDTPYGYEAAENVELMKNMLIPNVNLLYRIDSLDYYDNLMDRRHGYLLGYLGSDRAQTPARLVDLDIPMREKLQLFLERLPVLSAYNVRYIISAYRLTHDDLKEVFAWNATRHKIPLYLYELKEVGPRYYLAGEVLASSELSEEVLWEKNLERIRYRTTLIECESCPEVMKGKGVWSLVDEKSDEYRFQALVESSQYFVFGQNFLPGWRALVDGKESTIYRANYVNQAVLVPAGIHEVVFTYD